MHALKAGEASPIANIMGKVLLLVEMVASLAASAGVRGLVKVKLMMPPNKLSRDHELSE